MPNRLPTRSPHLYSVVALAMLLGAWIAGIAARSAMRRHQGLGRYDGMHLER